MRKEYEAPKAEKMEFNYLESVVASGCGGVWREYTDGFEGCKSKETEHWINPYNAQGN